MRRAAFSILTLAVLTACVTVNVYFPEAEVRDLSKQIEQEVRKQAAQQSEVATVLKELAASVPRKG